MFGLYGESIGPDPVVQIGNGASGHHGAQQGANWELLLLLFVAAILLGAAVLGYVVVQRMRLQARRRAKRHALAGIAAPNPVTRTAAIAVIADDWRTVASEAREISAKALVRMPRVAKAVQYVMSAAAAPASKPAVTPPTTPALARKKPTSDPANPAVAIALRPDTTPHHGRRTRADA